MFLGLPRGHSSSAGLVGRWNKRTVDEATSTVELPLEFTTPCQREPSVIETPCNPMRRTRYTSRTGSRAR
jgi:hypothetical protein